MNGEGDGDGNGFKLGGDGIAVAHKLVNSISYNNNHAGITSNSYPAAVIENSISYGNKGNNISLYGKGSGDRNFVAKNLISMAGGSEDNISEMPSLATENNYLWNGAVCANSKGVKLDDSIFKSTDLTIAPTRDKDGSINMNGLLELNDKAPAGIGASFTSTALVFDEKPVAYKDNVESKNTTVVATDDSYVVKAGDTLSKIAKAIFGKESAWKVIFELNKDTILNPDLIFIGQKLKLK